MRKENGIETGGCCGVGTGYIKAAMSVPQTAYVVGHTIPVEVWIENHSRRQLRPPACVNLIQDVHFRSVSYFQTATDTKTISRVVNVVEIGNPERGQTLANRAAVRIPPKLPATSTGNTIITMAYKLRLEVGNCFDIVLPIGIASKL